MVVLYLGFPGATWVALAIFIVASLTDMLDGKIARKRNLVTNFGKFADPIADKLLVMSALIVMVGQGRIPSWVCVLILAREFVISGFRLVAVEGGRVIAAGKLGKLKTVTQMIAILLLLLLVPVEGDALLGYAGIVAATIVLYLSLFFTVVSGAEYIIRNFDCIRDM